MKEQVLQKIKAINEKAKAIKTEAKTGHSRNSLAETIKTKQQAENLKKQLKALQ